MTPPHSLFSFPNHIQSFAGTPLPSSPLNPINHNNVVTGSVIPQNCVEITPIKRGPGRPHKYSPAVPIHDLFIFAASPPLVSQPPVSPSLVRPPLTPGLPRKPGSGGRSKTCTRATRAPPKKSHKMVMRVSPREILVVQNRRASPGPGAGPSRMVKNCKVEKDKFGDIIKTCGVNGCTHRTGNRNMKRHWSDAHNIDVVWHYCGIGDCKYKAKTFGNAKQHKALVHGLNRKWFYCRINGCEYKTKSHNSFKIHQNYTHDVDVVRNYCDIDGCQYWAKQMGELKNHQKSEHGYVNKYIRKVPVPDGQTKIDADREAAAAAASKLSEFGLRVQLGLA